MGGTFELEGFEPINRVGGGGFGDVWLARQVNVDREVAIKVGHSPIQDETIKLRFERECKALGRLSGHSNIVDVYTAGSLNDGRPYLVLEYVGGGTLWQKLKAGPISEPQLIKIGSQLAGALHLAHSTGILHRDLKPENILMRPNGDSVLGDFGIARLQDGANTTSAAITASVAYAAPEVLSGSKATVASDLYGLGICLLAAVLRTVPFVHKTDESIHPIINRVLSEEHPDIRQRGISEGLAVVIDSLLDKNPARRPANAEEVVESLARLETEARVGAKVAAPPATPEPVFAGREDTVPRPVPSEDRRAPMNPQRSASIGDRAAARASAGPAVLGAQNSVGRSNRVAPVERMPEPEPSLFRPFALAFLTTVLLGALAIFAIYSFVL